MNKKKQGIGFYRKWEKLCIVMISIILILGITICLIGFVYALITGGWAGLPEHINEGEMKLVDEILMGVVVGILLGVVLNKFFL